MFCLKRFSYATSCRTMQLPHHFNNLNLNNSNIRILFVDLYPHLSTHPKSNEHPNEHTSLFFIR